MDTMENRLAIFGVRSENPSLLLFLDLMNCVKMLARIAYLGRFKVIIAN